MKTQDTKAHRYTAEKAGEIELHWQEQWRDRGVHRQPNPSDPAFDPAAEKFYILDMFPYPSGAGLHVGHPEGYTATDILARYKRMRGFNVLRPMGWDAFGLPAEQYAIQTGVHPAQTTRKAIDNFRRQLQRFGFSYDWSREFATIDEDYYRWTQWIFVRIYDAWYDTSAAKARPISDLIAEFASGARPPRFNPDASEISREDKARTFASWNDTDARTRRAIIDSYRLAYIGEQTVNWCPKLGTALANEEVIDGKSERGSFPVFRKPLRQWMFRITAYAERLLAGLADVDWPESTRTQQTEWIGRSEGAEIEFKLDTLGTPPLRGGSRTSSVVPDVMRLLDDQGPSAFHPIAFEPRDPYPEGEFGAVADLVRTDRRLPHLRLDGATYFVTWKAVEGLTFDEQERDAVLDALRYFDDDRCRVYAATVMSNHVHWIVRPLPGHSLDDLITSVKRFSAKRINELRGASGHVWMPEQFDHIIRDRAYFAKFIEYVVLNPVEAGVVRDAAQYRWTIVHQDSIGTDDARSAPEGRGTQEPSLRVFTTRPDTLFGATYMVVAPEHPLVADVLASPTPETPSDALRAYVNAARNRSDVERQESKEKTGVFTGVYAINPATATRIPVWTSDYVLMGYGTGAIMAVPAHDQRDFEFAEAFDLPIVDVVYPAALYPIWWLGTHARDEDLLAGDPDLWRDRVADFAGYVVSNSTEEADFAKAAHLVIHERPRRTDANAPERQGPPRGAVRTEWLDVLDSMGFESYDDFRERMRHPVRSRRLGEAYAEAGRSINSANAEVSINGLRKDQAIAAMIDWFERKGVGTRRINYKLRDWLFSRQRYWGEPFPIVYDDEGNHYAVDPSKLPVTLPDMADYQPVESDEPQPLLAKATDWMATTAAECGIAALPPETALRRESNTMPGWAGSCWYYLRYCDPKNASRFVGEEAEHYWMGEKGVDLYIGGAEHAVLHLLYARFWHQVLYDLGEVSSAEPFRKLFHQGLILSHAYQRADKTLVGVDMVEERDGRFFERETGEEVASVIAKMSKSLKNVVNPDDIIAEYGADTFRLYEMYLGPLESAAPWNTNDTIGLFRFLQKVWRLVIDEDSGELKLLDDSTRNDEIEKRLHRTIDKVAGDIERLAFNTAIAAMIEFVNAAQQAGGVTRDQLERFASILAPFAPHIAQELWHRLGHESAIDTARWPTVDDAMLRDDEVEVPVQIMGKVRARITIPADADAKVMEAIALADPKVVDLIEGKTVRKVIAVPGRMVNIVAN